MKNWFFFFNSEHISRIEKVKNNNRENYRTWLILTVGLPLAPFIVSILIHLFYHGLDEIGAVINNGSLPIISFGIISSGILYLLEKIDKKDLIIEQIKSRIMAIAVMVLFLTASLFILQSTYMKIVADSTDTTESKIAQNVILFVVSIILFWYARRVGENMFFIQKKIQEDESSFDKEVRDGAKKMGHGETW